MATSGEFSLDLNELGALTNNVVGIGEKVTEAVADFGDLIGMGIAIAISLTLIFGAIFIAIMVIPRLIRGLKGIRSA